MIRNVDCTVRARKAQRVIQEKMGHDRTIPVGIILGSGWGDSLSELRDGCVIPFETIPGFEPLLGHHGVPGHARELVVGEIGTTPIAALRGRIHLNESCGDRKIVDIVRLQVEMLIMLGVKRLILTCAAGGLAGGPSPVVAGDVVFIDGFVTCFAPPMPLYPGEFCDPESAIDYATLQMVSVRAAYGPDRPRLREHMGGHVMLPGPQFEGRRYDKTLLAQTGAKIVSMSMLPEACVAALYPDVKVLPIAYVTNGPNDEHSHEANLERAQKDAAALGAYLRLAVTAIG